MRCYNCNKDFDYEKYYGICPKCGCYNKKVSAQERHQQYHDQYDGGYRHREAPAGSPVQQGAVQQPNPVYGQQQGYVQQPNPAYGRQQGYVQVSEVKNTTGGTAFLILSVVFLLCAVLFGTLGEFAYEDHVEQTIIQGDIGQEAAIERHSLKEEFTFQGLTLKVEEAKALATWEELDLPEGKVLVAVKLSGRGDGEWADYNEISDAYIRCNDICYPQISYYDFDGIGRIYKAPPLDPFVFRGETEGEGWIGFLVNEGTKQFTLCLEERVDEDLAFIQTIHFIEIEL